MAEINNNDFRKTLDAYFNEHSLVWHQINSYNTFVTEDIQRIISQESPYSFKIDKVESNIENDIINKNVKTYEIKFIFHEVELYKPKLEETNGHTYDLFPSDARNKDLKYQSPIFLRIDYNIQLLDKTNNVLSSYTILGKTPEKIGYIPVMLRSKLCNLDGLTQMDQQFVDEDPYDYGGYFIINGNEKIIIPQEKRTENVIFLFQNKGDTDNYSFVTEIKTVRDEQIHKGSAGASIKVKLEKKHGAIFVSINPGFSASNKDIPLAILFRTLGILTDKQIAEYIVSDLNDYAMLDLLGPSLNFQYKDFKTDQMVKANTQDDALQYIADRLLVQHKSLHTDELKKKAVLTLFDKYLFPHVPDIGTTVKEAKARFLGLMVNRLLEGKLGRVKPDDRDDLGNKRIDLTGQLLAQIFKHAFKNSFLETMKKNIQKEFSSKNFKSQKDFDGLITRTKNIKSLTNPFHSALLTGIWKISNTTSLQNKRAGVAQMLHRKNRFDTISASRRIFTPSTSNSQNKSADIRRLHPSVYGMICPVETPDGQQTGIVKHLAITCQITVAINPAPVLKLLDVLVREEKKLIYTYDIAPTDAWKMTKVFVNGNWVGSTQEPKHIYDKLKEFRRNLLIDPFVTIYRDFKLNEINVNTDAGRTVRPLYIVNEGNKLAANKKVMDKLTDPDPLTRWSWKDLIEKQIVEWVDVKESEHNCVVAMYPDELNKVDPQLHVYTHCEIHPSCQLGVLINLIPFSNHNQAPRNLFQGAMGKQSIDLYNLTFKHRMDNQANILHYPQKPLVTTYISEPTNFHKIPSGMNAIVAIAMYTGYNQEDSIIANKASIEKGLFISTKFKSTNETAKNEEKFTKPDPEKTAEIKSHANYNKLNKYGLVPPGTFVEKNDVLIGKVANLDRNERNGKIDQQDISVIMKEGSAIVESNFTSTNEDGNEICKVKFRIKREPQIGDKLSSRHGQKGTIGMIYSYEDMPFTAEGMTPDLIVNPQAIPSRMTIGQLMELVTGKVGVLKGVITDATAYTEMNIDQITNELKKFGFNEHGYETMYNGFTGEPFQTMIFIGPTYYQRLKHIADEKIHARSTGPVQMLTRQPLEGRSRDGGLKFGEMERDAMIAHGTVQFLKERFYESSDKYEVYMCETCGIIAISNPEENIYKCNICNKNNVISNIVRIKIPYAAKLLIHEIQGLCINIRLFPTKYKLT